jgi:hypothetical protein
VQSRWHLHDVPQFYGFAFGITSAQEHVTHLFQASLPHQPIKKISTITENTWCSDEAV